MSTQLSKLDTFQIRTNVESDGKRRYRFRPRTYDEAILRYVAYYRTVTLHQIAYRFFVYAGKGGRYGYFVVKRMVGEGLLKAEPLDPELGSSSRLVLTVGDIGWRVLGIEPRRDRHAAFHAIREYRLQFADLMLEREASGWLLVPAAKTFHALRSAALAEYRNRLLNPSEVVIRERLERMPPFDIRLRAIRHVQSRQVRLILPVRPGKSFKTTIDTLPPLGLMPVVEFELVCSDPRLIDPARGYLDRWASQTKTRIRVHQHPHYRTRKPPGSRADVGVNRYARFGLDPLSLL